MSVPTRLRRRPSTARRLASATAIAAAGVAIALGTTGCGAGQISQTANQLPAINGGNATATWGPVDIRNLQIIYPAKDADDVFGNGGPFEVSYTIANSGTIKTYKLTKIEVTQKGAPSSASVTLGGEPTIAPGTAIRAGNPANVRPDGSTPSMAAPTSASPSSTPRAGASDTTASATAAPSTTALGDAAMTATLTGTGRSVAAGLTTELTFYFQQQDDNGNWVDAGTVRAEATVDASTIPTRQDTPRGGDEAEGASGH